jgi:RHS repeat-associated protein
MTNAFDRVGCSVFLNNRYQDPTTGVFLSVDPLVAKTGQAYLYAAGNPTTLSDPSGLDPKWAYDNDACNDNDYYDCTYKAGYDPTKPHGPGRRQCSETGYLAQGCAHSVSHVPPRKPLRPEDVGGAKPGDEDLVQDLIDAGDAIASATTTTGACVTGGVGVFGWGADIQHCDFTTPEGDGNSWTIGASIGLEGPNLNISGTTMTSNAEEPDDFDGDTVCLSGSLGYGVAAVCGGLNSRGELTGIYQVFLGTGVSVGVPSLATISYGYTWAFRSEPEPITNGRPTVIDMTNEMCGCAA